MRVLSSIICCWYVDNQKRDKRSLLAFEMRCYQNLLNIWWHQKITMTASDNNWTNKRLLSAPSDIKANTVWAYMPHAGQSTTKEWAIWLYGRSTMSRKTAKAVIGLHHWVDWSEYRRCCEKTQDCDDWRSFVFGLNGPLPWDMMMMMWQTDVRQRDVGRASSLNALYPMGEDIIKDTLKRYNK